MKNKEIKKALKSDTPINSMYSLIPNNKMQAFKKFAAQFGFTEERIKTVLENEKR
ncbi:hypothetical protein [Bacteroides sp. AM23-12]|uniref:hypothetical protein n=1 Tax=Bacteroides sp. AM23-12 TaxID=2292942 RepID=UPI0018F31B88|nr:hypothetical protein [Bacteroides sp. AM23-12]